ncbi:dixin-A-like [Artemia franciscana]|uniref:dixin-A-like n=1 Tax=Artemia franciscana TaxID=6661 RepID=UPI0032DADFF2
MLLERLTTSEQTVLTPISRGSEEPIAARKSIHNSQGPQETTKALYFTDRSLTPFLIILQGRLGEVVLRDFKMAIDRPNRYRFLFKTPDPDYGFVKQEITDDDGILPGFDGKVVAWLEEDCL